MNPNTEEVTKQDTLFDRTQVENTPFMIISEKDEEGIHCNHFVTCGHLKVSPDYASMEDALQDALEINWDKITALIEAMLHAKSIN